MTDISMQNQPRDIMHYESDIWAIEIGRAHV